MAVACGYEHTLTLDDNGDVWSFGNNYHGQCGIDNNGKDVKLPTKVHGLMDIVCIAAGSYFSACVDVNGHVWTFGNNNEGQLGHGDHKNRNTPTRVEGLDNIVSIFCSNQHTMCISSDHKVYAFGYNNIGQLGIGANLNELSPVLVPLDVDIKQITCGTSFSVFLTYDGDIWVCGRNDNYQLGLGDKKNRDTPVKNPYLNDIVSIQSGGDHTIVLNSEHQLFKFGQFFLNDMQHRHKPEPIQFSREIQSFSCGEYFTMILDTSNRVWVFGLNYLEGDRIDGYTDRIMLKEPSNVCWLSSGSCGNHVLLKCTSNEIWAFGRNNCHQIPLPAPKTDKIGEQIIRKPEKIPLEYNHIIGTPIDRFKSRAKSARSNFSGRSPSPPHKIQKISQ